MPAFTFEKLSPPATEASPQRSPQTSSSVASKSATPKSVTSTRGGVMQFFGRLMDWRTPGASSREDADHAPRDGA